MQNDLTPNLGLPLPHPGNELEDDVLRLRDALSSLDTAVGTLRALVSSDDLNMDTVQEVVNVLKAAQGDIGNVTELLATKAGTDQLAQLQTTLNGQLAAMQEAVDQALTAKANTSDVNTALADKLDKAGGVMSGVITFHSGQTFPASKVTGLPGYASALKYQ